MNPNDFTDSIWISGWMENWKMGILHTFGRKEFISWLEKIQNLEIYNPAKFLETIRWSSSTWDYFSFFFCTLHWSLERVNIFHYYNLIHLSQRIFSYEERKVNPIIIDWWRHFDHKQFFNYWIIILEVKFLIVQRERKQKENTWS